MWEQLVLFRLISTTDYREKTAHLGERSWWGVAKYLPEYNSVSTVGLTRSTSCIKRDARNPLQCVEKTLQRQCHWLCKAVG